MTAGAPSRSYRAALSIALALVRIVSLLVPARERSEWLEEWRGELHFRYGERDAAPSRYETTPSATPRETTPIRPPDTPLQPLRDAGGALPDALWHAREDWRLDMLHHDLRFALRTLLARPAFTLTVVITLALGIGANAVIYSAVDAVVLNPFDFDDPDAIVGVGTIYPTLNQELGFFERLSAPEIADILANVPALEDVAAFDLGNRQIVGGDQPQNVFTGFWWHDVLPVLGLEPVLGRGFRFADVADREAVALISQRVWQTRFGADPNIVGTTIRIDDEPYTVIGVFPPEALIYGTDLWMPMWSQLDTMPRNRRQYNVIARLADGAGIEQANAQLEALARRTEQAHGAEFEEYAGWRLVAQTWTDVNVQTLKPAAVILLGAVGFVLLLVCTNVASLLLSRSAGRQREIAVRAALGAGRVRIVRQLLTESTLLAVGGGVAGVLLAYFGLAWLAGAAPANLIPSSADLEINGRVLGYSAFVSLLAGIVFGLAPAVQSARFDLQQTLALDGGKATGSRGRHRLHGFFVATEVALALVLLVGAGLLVSSFLRLGAVDPGVDTDNVLTMRLTLPWSRYEGEGIANFFEQLTAGVATIPGVSSVGSASQFPPLVFSRRQFIPEGGEIGDEGALPAAYLTIADPGYFEALGIPLVRGRALTHDDRLGTPWVTVVNQTLADTYFPGVDPIGKRIDLGSADDELPVVEIVGVSADAKNRGLGVDTAPELVVSLRQASGASNQIFLIARTAVAPETILDDVRAQVAAIDPEQPVYSVSTLEERFASQFAPQRFALVMLAAFAAMALALAAVGIYGVVSHAVTDRTREIGVRMALGAGRAEVVGMIVRQALLPVAFGLAVGLALAVAISDAMEGLLYEARGVEPLTLAAVIAVLGGIAFLASWMPARRASAIDPVNALRAE